jgi:hypothetical protein
MGEVAFQAYRPVIDAIKAHSESFVQISLATSQESKAMKSIALITMLFLPGTFFAVWLPSSLVGAILTPAGVLLDDLLQLVGCARKDARLELHLDLCACDCALHCVNPGALVFLCGVPQGHSPGN